MSKRTLEYYEYCLTPFVRSYPVSSEGVNSFLTNLNCGNAKANYHSAIKTFCNWLYKQGYIEVNPIARVDKPLTSKRLLPAITEERLGVLLSQANSLRDRCILSLLFDSGLRVSEVCSINPDGIDWSNNTLKVVVKGNQEAKAAFTSKTATLLKEYLSSNGHNPTLFDIKPGGIKTALKRLSKATGIRCNPHSFRRGFACSLHRRGLSTLDIMHLGRWKSLPMVERYTRSITFDDCLEHYRRATNKEGRPTRNLPSQCVRYNS
jgi:integrase/recombinase XerC